MTEPKFRVVIDGGVRPVMEMHWDSANELYGIGIPIYKNGVFEGIREIDAKIYKPFAFTGYHDKNAEELWEGDRGHLDRGTSDTVEVAWNDEDGRWEFRSHYGFRTWVSHQCDVFTRLGSKWESER